jgi:hypothetical protein
LLSRRCFSCFYYGATSGFSANPQPQLKVEKKPRFQKIFFPLIMRPSFKNAIAQKNLRLAVRLHYLETLALLAGKGILQYKEESTNSDYLLQVYPTPHYAVFKKLTRHFEYAWYGQFEVGPDAYRNIETDFATFKNSMAI